MNEKKTILVVDDHVDLVEMIKFQLINYGYDVVTSSNGAEALGLLGHITPDLVILDLNMPKLGGIEFCHRIMTAENKLKYPVLMITARANTEDVVKNIPISGFIMKPFQFDHLIKEVKRILG